MRIDRRAFFARSGVLAGVAGSLESLFAASQKRGAQPRRIIFLVADGMSPSVLPLAEQFSLRVRGKGLLWHALLDRPEAARGWMDMASLDSLVTDSSSASSSWGSGSRIFNGWVNVLPDGTRLTPIMELTRDKGWLNALVTTATVTHATPAGFAASVRRRDDEHLIAEQYLGKVDVILGGGRRFFSAETRKDGKDLIAGFRSAGYAFVESRTQLRQQGAGAKKLLGLFSSSHMPYTVDHRNSESLREQAPTLAEMTEAALALLEKQNRPYLIQIEGARVDHAAHANDAAGLLWDQIAFDEAIETVLRFVEKRPDTLVVITSDHGNSNPGLVGMGIEYRQSNACFERLAGIRASFSTVAPQLAGRAEYSMSTEQPSGVAGGPPPVERMQELARQHFGFAFTPEECEILRRCAAGEKKLCVNRQLDSAVGILGQVVGNHTGIHWTGTTHTSDYTLVTALGPGAERFSGFLRNTEVFGALTQLAGIEHRNPSMDPAEAARYRQVAFTPRERPDWA
ncbi:MAG: alkaline phosphatase [Bryobacteraceae bacterium]|nr:alkaline phosphatase [Bryobacteraceae bacterium]